MPSIAHILVAVLGLASFTLAACNGQDALCSRAYSNVTFVGSHDSAFVGLSPFDNQLDSIADQLGMGIRFLQAQTHSEDGAIQMCHTSCDLLNAGTLTAYLTPIKTFMDANPNEVVTLLLTNGDAIPVSDFASVFSAVGLEEYAYVPTGTLTLSEWPTLQSMIDSGKRLVVWMDYNADTSSVDYILPEFDYYNETPYDETDASFPDCNIDRPAGETAVGRMYIINHMLHIEILDIQAPYGIMAGVTNSVNSIVAQADLCEGTYSRAPNVVLLDFTNAGDPIGAQDALNGL